MQSPKRKQILIGLVSAVVVCAAATFLPVWAAMDCGGWECSFHKSNLWAALPSYSRTLNQPEAHHALWVVLRSELLALIAVFVFSFVSGFAVARLRQSPN